MSDVSGISNQDEWALINTYEAYQSLQNHEAKLKAKRDIQQRFRQELEAQAAEHKLKKWQIKDEQMRYARQIVERDREVEQREQESKKKKMELLVKLREK
jgi:hypothetical protein